MNRWIGNLGAFAGSAAVMALLFELVCRTVLNTGSQYHIEMWKYAVQLKRISANPEIGHEHVPSGHARLMDAEVSINADGLRDREHAKAKAPGEVRIMMLGDSTMFGWGVKQNETIAKHVEQALNSQAPDTFVEVINTGVGNYNTAMEVAYFLARGVAFKPDIVVLNYFINDAEPTPVYRDVPWFARHSYAYAVLGGAWDGFKRRFSGEEQDYKAYYAGLYAAPGWDKAQAAIAKLAEVCRAQGIRLIISNIPELRALKPYAFPEVQEKIENVAKVVGAEYVDLLPAVVNEDPASLWVTVPDPHPNAKATKLMGDYLAAYLAQHPTAAAKD
jgi:lysophospholipase L1-like esterase